MEESLPAGFLTYPVSQAADILAFGADLVPVGEDQNPMIEQTNEIARRFNFIYKTECFKEVKPLIGKVDRLVGIDGKTKMSKSAGNAIFLSDSYEVLKAKV
jgi:tryptophanyl-tRNA synthetase